MMQEHEWDFSLHLTCDRVVGDENDFNRASTLTVDASLWIFSAGPAMLSFCTQARVFIRNHEGRLCRGFLCFN